MPATLTVVVRTMCHSGDDDDDHSNAAAGDGDIDDRNNEDQ